MKTIALIVLLSVIWGYSCNNSSGESVPKPAPVSVREDSIDYYPHTHAKLTQQQFRTYYRNLANYFYSILLRRGFNGGILEAKEGNIVYEKYDGLADLRKKTPMTDSTMMHIASAGKTFTGMAIVRLAQENMLALS